MGVLVFVTAIFSDRSTRTSHIMRAEMPGPTLGKIASKWQFSVRILYGIYIGMTVLMFVLLLFGGMDVFDSMVHTFGAAGTGGFGIKNASMGYYNSAYIDYVIAVFMMLFAVNFNIYYFMLTRQFDLIKVNSELKAYLGIVAASVILIAINIMPIYSTASESLRYSFFQVSSVISTTGYATDDFCKWPVFSQMILLMLMFVGGCAGSTGGGIKVIRISIIWKCAVNEVKKSINPRRVLSVKNDGKPLDNAVVHGVMGYMMVYLAVMVLSMVVVSIDNFDLTTVSTAVITALNNIGPGLGMVGPTGNFSEFSVLSKLVLTFDMLAGRLELFSMIAVFMPSVWRRR